VTTDVFGAAPPPVRPSNPEVKLPGKVTADKTVSDVTLTCVTKYLGNEKSLRYPPGWRI